MAHPTPSFSSFPDLEAPTTNHVSSSKQPIPSFGSFPTDVAQPGTKDRPRDRSDDPRDGESTRRRTGDESSRRRRRSRSDDEREERRRERKREERRARDRDRERDDEERARKEDRRRRERDKAEKLRRDEHERMDRKEMERRIDKLDARPELYEVDDGGAWYESVTKARPRVGYQEPYDPLAPSTSYKDTAGDREAAKYNPASSHSAPKYHRDGGGRVLGLNDGMRVVMSRDRKEKGIEIAPRGRPYVPRYNARTLEGSSSRHLGRRLVRSAQDDFDPSSSFIQFDSIASMRGLEEDGRPDYRAISRAAPNEDDDDAAADDALSSFSTLEQDIRQRTIDAEQHLKLRPDDVDAWIAFSTLHLKLSPELANRPINALVDPLSLPQNRASAEVTLSILTRALDAHPVNFLSPKLHIAYLRAAELIWRPEQITNRWKNVLRELSERRRSESPAEIDAGMLDVWLGYIDWTESRGFGKTDDGVGFGFDQVVEVYAECIKQMGRADHGLPFPSAEGNLLYLLTRLCEFIRSAGYTERSLATFQAMMELTFFKPDHLRPPRYADWNWFEGVLAEFEDFWDDEGPRIGENGGTGWKNAMGADVEPATPKGSEAESDDDFARWLNAERHAERTQSRPGRSKNLDDDDDVFRVVLFADVKPFLFPVRSPEIRLQLVYAFFNYLGLPISRPETSSAMPITRDPHLRTGLAYNDVARSAFWPPKAGPRAIPWQTVGGEPMSAEAGTALQHPFGSPVKCWATQATTLFAGSGRWFRDIDAVDLDNLDVDLIRNAFLVLRPLILDPAFTLSYFAFESAASPKTAIKAAKAILAEERDSLLLWDGYARLEQQRGKIAIARTVFATALRSEVEADAEDRRDVWASWADMEFEQGSGLALEVTLLAAGIDAHKLEAVAQAGYQPTQPAALALLKATQYHLNQNLPTSQNALILSAIFAYATDGIDAARDVINRQLNLLPAGSAPAEEAFQLLTRMLYCHTSRHASPAALARGNLEAAMEAFPNNTSFLSLYLYGELGNRVYGRVQRLVSRLSNSEDAGVVGHLWAVWAEAMSSHRTFWDRGGGGAERVRTALDKAVNSRAGRSNVTLWKLYVEFEGLMRRWKAAKQLCYRAISALGGCKELYLLPLSPMLRPHFEDRELRQMAELMVERGVRVRVPFEGYFDLAVGDDGVMALPDDEELREDELSFLREREVLKPYSDASVV